MSRLKVLMTSHEGKHNATELRSETTSETVVILHMLCMSKMSQYIQGKGKTRWYTFPRRGA